MQPLQEIVPLGSESAYLIREFIYEIFDVRWHHHAEYELTLINKGKGKRIIGDNVSDFESGDLTLIGPDLPHLYKEEVRDERDRKGAHCVVLQINKDFPGDKFLQFKEVSQIRRLFEKSRQGLQFTGETAKRISERMKTLLSNEGIGSILDLIEILNELSMTTEYTILSSTGFTDANTNSDQERAGKVYNYVLSSYAENISLEKAAEMINLSKSAFCNYFKKRTNKSFSEFVNELRIGKACKMLVESDASISTICFNVGFSNISYFNRKFREINKMSPLEYRKMFL